MNFLSITTELADSPRIKNSEVLSGICSSILALYPNASPVSPWIGYLAEDQGTIVGTCAFKAPPLNNAVEIAYFTLPEFEGRGIATNMAKRLVEIAAGQGIGLVIAQTLPEHNASTHILKKLKFTFAGVVQHPEDGEVWQWEYSMHAK